MSEDGKNISLIIHETRKLYEQLALLLQTADRIMEKKKWARYGNTAVNYLSMNLFPEYWRYWLPSEVFSFYENKKLRNIRCYISILVFNPPNEQYVNDIEEPLITFGWFDFDKGDEDWKWWHSRFYQYITELKKGEQWKEANPAKEWNDGEKYFFNFVRTRGLPLVEITDEKLLIEKVINPLLEDIERHSRENAG